MGGQQGVKEECGLCPQLQLQKAVVAAGLQVAGAVWQGKLKDQQHSKNSTPSTNLVGMHLLLLCRCGTQQGAIVLHVVQCTKLPHN